MYNKIRQVAIKRTHIAGTGYCFKALYTTRIGLVQQAARISAARSSALVSKCPVCVYGAPLHIFSFQYPERTKGHDERGSMKVGLVASIQNFQP